MRPLQRGTDQSFSVSFDSCFKFQCTVKVMTNIKSYSKLKLSLKGDTDREVKNFLSTDKT